MKAAVITCYKHPDYIRAVTIRRAIAAQPGIEMYVLKNTHKNIIRYPEIMCKILWLRITMRPDVYVVTFRGYEILPFAAVAAWPKKLIFDELVNPIEWLQESRAEKWAAFIPQRLLKLFYRWLLRRASVVICDTPEHAAYSAKLLNMKSDKFMTMPVGTDEETFQPSSVKAANPFKVFYYGNMLPLHGIDIVLKAAEKLKDIPIEFEFAGGSQHIADLISESKKRGANITYHTWVPFSELAEKVEQSSLLLGGPFGKTTQANMVITGKAFQFLASAKPTLVGDTESGRRYFTDKINCLIVPLGDADALASQIQWAHEHPKQLQNIGIAGKQLYDAEFSSDVLAREMSKIISSAMQ